MVENIIVPGHNPILEEVIRIRLLDVQMHVVHPSRVDNAILSVKASIQR